MFDGNHSEKKTYSSGSRIFVGFSKNQLRASRLFLENHVLNHARKHTRFGDVTLHPPIRVAKGEFQGGVFSEGRYVPELSLTRGPLNHPVVTSPSTRDEPVASFPAAWFGGVMFNHYGHFVIEGLSRLADDRISQSDLPVLFFNPHRITSLKGYMRDTLARFGVDPLRVRLIDQPTHVGALEAIDPYIAIRGFVNVTVTDWLKAHGTAAAHPSGLIYLSRSKLKDRRGLVEEEELEDDIRMIGGEVLFPEQLSIDEQIARLSDAKVIAGAEGSAFHTLLFAAGTATKIILCHRFPNANYLLQDEIVDGTTIYINASAQEKIIGTLDEWSITDTAKETFNRTLRAELAAS